MPEIPKGLQASISPIAVVAALAASLLGLLWDFRPELRPEQHNNRAAVASIATVDRNVSQSDGRATACPTSAHDEVLGAVVYLKYKANGFKNGTLRLRCSIFDADLHTPLSPTVPASRSTESSCRQASAGKRAEACGYVSIPTDTTDERAVKPLWVAIPASRANIRVRVAVYTSDDDTMLAYADSPTFRSGVLSSPQVRTASRAEEETIVHDARASLSSQARHATYVAAVAILRSGAAFARGKWAAADVRPFPSFPNAHRRTLLLHRQAVTYWKVIPPANGCDVPREIVASLGLAARACPRHGG